MLNGTNIVSEFSGQELTMDCSTLRPSLAISVSSFSPVPLNDIEDLSMWLQAASPVSHFQDPENNLEPTIPATCGQRRLTPYASYDQDTHCWRTFQLSLIADISDEYLATWPKWGSMHDGECFPLVPLVRHIHGKDCSFWPTPAAVDHKAGFNNLTEAKRAVGKERRASGAVVHRRVPYDYLIRYGEPVTASFYEWLMGIPIGATGLKPLAMDGFRLWRQQHGLP